MLLVKNSVTKTIFEKMFSENKFGNNTFLGIQKWKKGRALPTPHGRTIAEQGAETVDRCF